MNNHPVTWNELGQRAKAIIKYRQTSPSCSHCDFSLRRGQRKNSIGFAVGMATLMLVGSSILLEGFMRFPLHLFFNIESILANLSEVNQEGYVFIMFGETEHAIEQKLDAQGLITDDTIVHRFLK